MKNNYRIILLLLLGFSANLFAQKEEFNIAYLKHQTLLKGPTIYFEALENRGTQDFVRINERLQELVDERTKAGSDKPNSNRLVYGGLFEKSTGKENAAVVLSGYYQAKSGSDRDEIALLETGNNIGSPLPYFEWRTTNSANLLVMLTFTYADGTMRQDSLWIEESSVQRAGKKLLSVKTLEESVAKQFKNAYEYHFNFIDVERRWLDFPSVKVKDKALKAEYKEAKELIKSYKIIELGRLYKKLYEAENTDEAAIGLGLCYEILGNYPAAAELFEGRSDFHIKTRIRKEMALYDYLVEIGAKINLTTL